MSVTYLDEPAVGKGVTYLDEEVATPDIGIDESPFQVPEMKLGVIPEAPPEHPTITSRDPMQRTSQNYYNNQRDTYNKKMAANKAEIEHMIAAGYPVSPEAAAFYGVELPEAPKPKKEKVPKGIYAGEQTAQMEQVATLEQPRTYTTDTRTPVSLDELPGAQDYTLNPVRPIPSTETDMMVETLRNVPEAASRTAGSAISGLALSALNAAKGITELNEKVTPKFIKNIKDNIGYTALEDRVKEKVDNLVTDLSVYRQQMQNEIRKDGGVAAEVAQGIGDSALNTAVMLASLGVTGFTGTGATVRAAVAEAGKFGALMAATTPGTAADRIQAGAHAAVMMLMPIPLAKLPKTWMSVTANIVGLNLLSKLAGDFSVERAKEKAIANGNPEGWVGELLAEGIPSFVINGVFGSLVKSAKQGNAKAQAQLDAVPPEVTDVIQPWTPEKWGKITKALDIPLLKTVEQTPRQLDIAASKGEIPLEAPQKPLIVPETPSKVAIPAEPDIIAPPAEIGAKVPLEGAKQAEQPISQPEVKQPVAEQATQISELKPLLEHPMPFYVIADKAKKFNTAQEFEDFVKFARAKSTRKEDEWTSYDFEKQFGNIKDYFEWTKGDRENIGNVVKQYENIIDKLNVDDKTKALWKKDIENFELNYETSKSRQPPQGVPIAIQKPSPETLDVLPETRNGETVAKGNAEVQGVAGETITTGTGAEKEVASELSKIDALTRGMQLVNQHTQERIKTSGIDLESSPLNKSDVKEGETVFDQKGRGWTVGKGKKMIPSFSQSGIQGVQGEIVKGKEYPFENATKTDWGWSAGVATWRRGKSSGSEQVKENITKAQGKGAEIKTPLEAAIGEAEQAVATKEEWGIGGTDKMNKAIKGIAKKHGVDETELRKNVLWQAKVPPSDTELSTIEQGRKKVGLDVKTGLPITEPAKPTAEPPREVTEIKGKSLGAAAVDKLGVVTTTFAEPGKIRLKGFLETISKSNKVSKETKKELSKLEPEYEQQRTTEMKNRVVEAFAKDESLVTEAETMVRNPAEDLDTKGAVGIALLEHYNKTGNDKASVALVEHLDPLMRGAGRLNQAASLMNKLTGKGWIDKVNAYLEKNKVKLPDDVQKQIELEFKLSSKIKDENARAEALHKTIAKITSYVPFKAGEWLDAFRYTNMLSNPQSHERNIWGNTVQSLITRPLSLMANKDFSGTKTYIANAWGSALSGEAFRVAGKSWNKDFSKFAESLDTPNASVFDTIRMEEGPQGKGKQVAWEALTFIPKFLNAQDKFFGSMIEAGEITRLGKQGKPPEVAQEIAKKLSNKYLYRDKLGKERDKSLPVVSQTLDGLANFLEKGRTTENPYIRWPMKFVVPFLRTPMRIAQFGAEASPLAWIGPRINVENIAKAKYGKSFEKLNESEQTIVKEDMNNRRGLASIGTMVTLLGVGAAMQGNTTWGAPQDPEAKKMFYASGRRPYSFRVGDKWIPMVYLGPFFLAFALPAAARDAFADNPNSVNESTITKLGLAAAGIPKLILTQTPMASVNGFLEALQGKVDTTVSAAVGFQAGQFIPTSGTIRWVNKIVDPTYRKPVSIQETIASGIPGLSKDVKAYQDEVGGDAKRAWTDIYLPYTIGTVKKDFESDYQNKMEILKAKMKYKKEKQDALKEMKRQ